MEKANSYFTGVKATQNFNNINVTQETASSLIVADLTCVTMKDFLPIKGTPTQVLGSDGVGNFQWVENTGAAESPKLGNTIVVDQIYGNNTTGSIGGLPFKTINAAISAATSPGIAIWVLPGTYNLTSGIVIPDSVSLRGIIKNTVNIQMLNVTSDTTLVTMGSNCILQDVTLSLTSTGHFTLKGIVFSGTSTQTSQVLNIKLTINNSTASAAGSSNVYAIESNGTGSIVPEAFIYQNLNSTIISVLSTGSGNKRGILISNTNILVIQNTNIYIAQPTSPTISSGSYVGIETADPANNGSIQVRTSTIYAVPPGTGHTYTSADILQTNPTISSLPVYIVSPGIQIGPGTDLLSYTSGNKGFATYEYSTIIYYGLKGTISSAPAGYMWPGTQAVSAGSFPDPGVPPAYYSVQQPQLLLGISAGLNASPGTTNTLTLLVRYTPISTGITVDTPFTVTFTGSDLVKSFYNSSLTLFTGDRIHLFVSYTTPSAPNLAHDITAELDFF